MTKIVFMGTPDFSVPVLKKILSDGYEVIGVVTQPDRPVGRKRVLTPPPVKVEAEKHGIPVYQPERIREKEAMEEIIALQADLIVTAAFGQILPKELLEAPKYGCVNVHASLLPELRGGAPMHYAILQGKEKTGITIMFMVEKLDAGDMLVHVEVPITETDTVGTLHDKLSVAGAQLLSESLPKLLKGELNPVPQEEEKATFAYTIKREQEKINWDKPGHDIYNHVRGLNPWPVAYTTYQGEVMKIWWVEKMMEKQVSPGRIIEVTEDGLIVGTGDGTAIKIIELQPAGKKRMKASDFLRGAKLNVGDQLGD